METNKAAQEINRIERELDAKGEPPVQPPKSGSGNSDEAGESPTHHHLDAVIVGAQLLAGIGLTFWVGEKTITDAEDTTQRRDDRRGCWPFDWLWNRSNQALSDLSVTPIRSEKRSNCDL